MNAPGTTTVRVDLGERAYPIHIGDGLLDDAALLGEAITSDQVVIVTNEVVAPLYLDRVKTALRERQLHEFIVADGEQSKALATFEQVVTFLLEQRIERTATIVALGGGVVGDLSGFVAASYQRGVRYVQLPTTLLAQVDSAVGGKTAVNHPLGKNMIGAFYQPDAVIADTASLASLPPREFAAGVAEVIKYGLIRDREFLDYVEENLDALINRDSAVLAHAIAQSCRNKAEIVARDEREGGLRAILNLGHTFGHAIETATTYGSWLHGEAVAAGTCMAARMSNRLGWLTADELERVRALMEGAALPCQPPRDMTVEGFLEIMSRDKKNIGGDIRLVLMKALGEAVVTRDYPHEVLRATIEESLEGA